MFSAQKATSPEQTPILGEQPQVGLGQNRTRLWRPLSLKSSFLTSTATGGLILLGIVGYLHFQDLSNGAVIFAKEGSGFTIGELFLFRYLPTILVVLFGMLISLIDLDVKRLEPWYRLSQPSISTEASPLLCRYDTNFVLNVTAKALRSR